MKQCSKCKEVKPYTEFSPHKLGTGGVRSICKPCSVAQVLAYRKTENGREVSRKAAQKYRATPEGRACRAEQARLERIARPAKFIIIRTRLRAKAAGIPFSLTLKDIVVPERCPVLGMPLKVGESHFRNPRFSGADDAPSLDRLDPLLGYVPGNVNVISWRANRLKKDATLEELEAIVQWLKTRQVKEGP